MGGGATCRRGIGGHDLGEDSTWICMLSSTKPSMEASPSTPGRTCREEKRRTSILRACPAPRWPHGSGRCSAPSTSPILPSFRLAPLMCLPKGRRRWWCGCPACAHVGAQRRPPAPHAWAEEARRWTPGPQRSMTARPSAARTSLLRYPTFPEGRESRSPCLPPLRTSHPPQRPLARVGA